MNARAFRSTRQEEAPEERGHGDLLRGAAVGVCAGRERLLGDEHVTHRHSRAQHFAALEHPLGKHVSGNTREMNKLEII